MPSPTGQNGSVRRRVLYCVEFGSIVFSVHLKLRRHKAGSCWSRISGVRARCGGLTSRLQWGGGRTSRAPWGGPPPRLGVEASALSCAPSPGVLSGHVQGGSGFEVNKVFPLSSLCSSLLPGHQRLASWSLHSLSFKNVGPCKGRERSPLLMDRSCHHINVTSHVPT